MAGVAVRRLGLGVLVDVIKQLIAMRAGEVNQGESSALLAKRWNSLSRRCSRRAGTRNKLVHSRLSERSTGDLKMASPPDSELLTPTQIARMTADVEALTADLEQFIGDMLRAFAPTDALPSPVRDGE
jgi:hypothetical protein